jgi:hypothetical protein
LAISSRDIFTFLKQIKKHLSFGLAVAMSRALSIPPSTEDSVTKSCVCQARPGGVRDMAGPIFFLPRVAGFPQPSVGIQRHFMVAEIPGFDLPNRLSGLTMPLFSRDGIVKLIFNKVK